MKSPINAPYYTKTISNKGFLDKLEAKRDPLERKKEELLYEVIQKAKKTNGVLERAENVFGDVQGWESDGFVEETIRPETGGIFQKLYGCSYLAKGRADSVIVEGLQLAKSLVSGFPRKIAQSIKSFPLHPIKTSIHFGNFVFKEIEEKVVRHYEYDPKSVKPLCGERHAYSAKEYNVVVQEIRRAAMLAYVTVFTFNISKPHREDDEIGWNRYRAGQRLFLPNIDEFRFHKDELGLLLLRLFRFLSLVLEIDNAYRLRFQDAFQECCHRLPRGRADIIEILNILIEREDIKYGSASKWKFIRMALRIGLFIQPRLKKFVEVFLDNLDLTKVMMDKADRFFALRWQSYNFGGKDKEWRFAEFDRINKEKEHVFLI